MPALQRVFTLAVLILVGATCVAQSDWAQFRGPSGEGHADAAPLRWATAEGIVWKAETPGRGWSSPVVRGDLVWITTAVETPDHWTQDSATIVV